MRSFRIFQQTLLRFNTSRCRFGTAPQQRYSPVLQRIIGRQTSPFSIASRVQSLRSRPSAIRKVLNRRFNSTNSPSPNPTPTLGSPSPEPPSLSLTQRLRKLSREYGWSALGVYFLLTALDFPFCFLAVRWLGTERIGQWEHTVVEWIKRASPIQIPPAWRRKEELEQEKEAGQMVLEAGKGELVVPYDHGVEEAERLNRSEKASKSRVDFSELL